MSEWQDISTARHDNSRVLLWNGVSRVIGARDTGLRREQWCLDNGVRIDPQPTHWCELPEPPG